MRAIKESPLSSQNESNSPPRNYRRIFAPGWTLLINGQSQNRHGRCPAKPTTVRLFALEQADLGVPVQHILAQLDAIEKLHDKWSLSNPVRTAIVQAALETIIKVDPPRSWPREDKVRFAQLDPDIRQDNCRREKRQRSTLRRAQNEAAEPAKKRHNGADETVKHKEVEQ